MNYQSTLKALKNKYPNTHNNVLLCLFKKYYPAITSSIMNQLKIDSSSLKECPVIYNDLGIPDGFNADDPIEISPIFLQRYVDSLIMKYNMIDDKYKKRKHLHTVLKPMLIIGASPDFTDEDIEDKPVDPEEFYTRNKDNINDLLVKIYDNSSELETLKLSNEEMQLVNFIDMYYFGLSNAFYFSDLLKNIYNELLRISKENNTFIEECYYIFKNTLYSKIKSKQYPSNKIDNTERDYKILPTNLKQSYKRKNNMQLKNYLQTKINISPKEAELIESVFKDYAKKKKQSRMEEALWDDIKNKAKSLIGKGNKSVFLLEGISKQAIYKHMVEVVTLPPDRVVSDKYLNFTGYKDKRKEVLAYFNSLGVSYDKGLIDAWEKTTNEVIQFFKPLITTTTSREIIFDLAKVFDILEIDVNLYRDFEIDSYVDNYIAYGIYKDEHDDALTGYLLKTSLKHNATKVDRSSLATPEDMKKMVENFGYLKQSFNAMSNTFKSIKNNIKTKFDELFIENDNPDKRKINQLGKDKLYLFFKSFYPNENMAEFNRKIGIDKKVIAQSSKNVVPASQENMKSMMSAKEKYDPSEGRLKKETNLKKYLHKRLTISEKEATLIESTVRQYVQNSKRKK